MGESLDRGRWADMGKASELEARFDGAMLEIYERAGRETGYWASYYLRMLRKLGGLATARRLLGAKATSEGYARLRDADRLDLTVEACVLRPEFRHLFHSEELNLAYDRLAQYGFQLDPVDAPPDLLAPTLASTLAALRLSDTIATLPTSRSTVTIQTLLRHEKRSPRVIDKVEHCWAPNKIPVAFEGDVTWPEFVLVRLLRAAGWQARWVKNWGTREFCRDVGDPGALVDRGLEVFEAIHAGAPALRGSGTWDVVAWRGAEVLFLESKQHGNDRLRPSQLSFLEAGLAVGVPLGSFAVVEYEAGRGGAATAPNPTSPVPPRDPQRRRVSPKLQALLDTAAAAAADRRIEYRDRVAAHGPAAIEAMWAWVAADRSPGFAAGVIEAVGQKGDRSSATRALRHLKELRPAWSGVIDGAIERLEPSRASRVVASPRSSAADVYIATGTPPPAQGPCDIRNRDGSACLNPGRHYVDGKWSCTTHFKALTRRGIAP